MLTRTLKFLNVVGYDGNLSLTNLAVFICLYKLLSSAQLSSCDVAALLAAIANYCHKRHVGSGAQDE